MSMYAEARIPVQSHTHTVCSMRPHMSFLCLCTCTYVVVFLHSAVLYPLQSYDSRNVFVAMSVFQDWCKTASLQFGIRKLAPNNLTFQGRIEGSHSKEL